MPDETKTYDLIIIGGGPAGIIGAATAKAAHQTVALVDNHRELGGAGVNTGTVPSKTLRETALALSGIKARKLTGVDLSLKYEATVADFLRHEQHVKAGFNAMISQQLRADKADVYFGTGSFVDAHTVRVQPGQARPALDQPSATGGEVLLHGESILIATGSSPLRPALFPFNSPEIYDSDTILALDGLPERLAVIGAGVIGSEYACTFAILGTHVDLIDGRDVLLPFLDGEMSRALAAAMGRNGVAFHLKENVQECRGRGAAGIRVSLSSGITLTVDAVLVAAGRKSNTEKLNLPAADIAVGERGLIQVDDQFRTSAPHIFAAGDVIGFPALASTSMEQARRAVRHALGLESRAGISHLLPNGIYTIPEVSMVGETEESLQEAGRGLHRRAGALSGQCPRTHHWRPGRLSQTAVPPRRHEVAWRAHHGRAGDRNRPRWVNGHAGGLHCRCFRRSLLQCPYAGRTLQVRDDRRDPQGLGLPGFPDRPGGGLELAAGGEGEQEGSWTGARGGIGFCGIGGPPPILKTQSAVGSGRGN